MLIILFGGFISCNLFGLVGVYREHFCLTTVFIGLQLLITIFGVVHVFVDPTFSVITAALWALVKSFLSLLYLRDLYRIREDIRIKQEEEELDGRGEQVGSSVSEAYDNEVFVN